MNIRIFALYNTIQILQILILMVFKSLFLSLIFFISFSAHSQNINEIVIKGLSNISRGTVLSYLNIETGDSIPNEKTIGQVSNSLFKSELFEDVKINVVDSTLVVSVKENPVIKFFDFIDYEEDKVLNEQIILDIKNNFNLKVGKIFVKKNLDNLLLQLKSLYTENAFYKTSINVKTNLDEQNRIGIELFFNEGEQALINKMEITGNKFFEQDDLLSLFDIGEPDFFIINFFTEKDHFNKRELDSGIEALKNKYFDEGFLDLSILEKKVLYNKETDSLNIFIKISEGVQYKLGEILFSGDILNFDTKILRNQISLNNGDNFKRSLILDGVKKITALFQDKGYAYADTKMQVKLIENTDLLEVNIQSNPNGKVFIDRINITGNYRTQDNVIRRQLKLLEGGVYSKSDLQNSINRIKRLGFFSDVDYELKRKLDNTDKVDMFLSVTEQKTGEISLGLAHSNSTGAAITAGISQNNILGTGNILDAKLSNSDAVEEMSFYFKNPHINNAGHTMSYGITNRTVNASDLGTSDYTLDEVGFSFGYGVPLSENSSIFTEMKLSSIDLKCGSSLKLYDEVNQCNSNDDLDFTASFSYTEDTLNDFYFPTDGIRSSFKTFIGLPVADFNYYLIETSIKGYQPVLDNKTFKYSSRFKTGTGYAGDELPFYKRFYEGGSSSVRGFDFNSLGSKYSSTNEPKGGEITWISSVGLGAPASFIGIDNKNMRVSAFVDGGLIGEKQSDFDLSEFRASSGLAFYWLTPIGPLGANFALPIIKKSGDSTSSFSFALGTSF